MTKFASFLIAMAIHLIALCVAYATTGEWGSLNGTISYASGVIVALLIASPREDARLKRSQP